LSQTKRQFPFPGDIPFPVEGITLTDADAKDTENKTNNKIPKMPFIEIKLRAATPP
jgi:hypothetical protein